MVILKCATCEKFFFRKNGQYNKGLKRGTKNFYCSLDCNPYSAPINNDLMPFRFLMWPIYKRSKDGTDLTEEFLKEINEKQRGRCAITGIPMEFKTRASTGPSLPYQASVDRIDNSRGYTKNNIRLVTYMANIARNTFSDDDVIKFCYDTTLNKIIDSGLNTFIISTREIK